MIPTNFALSAKSFLKSVIVECQLHYGKLFVMGADHVNFRFITESCEIIVESLRFIMEKVLAGSMKSCALVTNSSLLCLTSHKQAIFTWERAVH
jgi:hypothetical protein